MSLINVVRLHLSRPYSCISKQLACGYSLSEYQEVYRHKNMKENTGYICHAGRRFVPLLFPRCFVPGCKAEDDGTREERQVLHADAQDSTVR